MVTRSSIRVLALLAAGFLLATIVVELTLRLIAATPLWRVLPVIEVSLYGPDPRTGYAHRPGATGIWRTENRAHVTINRQGFRGDPLQEPRPIGEKRIAVVGDSMVEALQVDAEQMFTAVLERELRAAGHDVRVANFGLAGATPAVQLERVATHVAARQPDIVVLIPSLGDFFGPKASDDSAFPAWVSTGDGKVVLRHGFRDSGGYRFRTSAVGQFYYALLDRLQIAGLVNNRKNVGFIPLPPRTATSGRSPDPCTAERDYWRGLSDPIGWRRVAAYMNDMGKLGREQNFKPILTVRSSLVTPACAASVRPLRDAVWQQLSALAATAHIPIHDIDARVAGHLAPGDSPSELHGFRERVGTGHLNLRGHLIYAATLQDVLSPLWH